MTRLASQQLTRLVLVDLEIQRGNTTAIQGKVKTAETRMNGAKQSESISSTTNAQPTKNPRWAEDPASRYKISPAFGTQSTP